MPATILPKKGANNDRYHTGSKVCLTGKTLPYSKPALNPMRMVDDLVKLRVCTRRRTLGVVDLLYQCRPRRWPAAPLIPLVLLVAWVFCREIDGSPLVLSKFILSVIHGARPEYTNF
jgi:hypothetical protein